MLNKCSLLDCFACMLSLTTHYLVAHNIYYIWHTPWHFKTHARVIGLLVILYGHSLHNVYLTCEGLLLHMILYVVLYIFNLCMIPFADFEFLCTLHFVCSSCICSPSLICQSIASLPTWEYGYTYEHYNTHRLKHSNNSNVRGNELILLTKMFFHSPNH